MKVAVMLGIGKMGFTTRPIPQPKDDEVLVKLEYVGICGSEWPWSQARPVVIARPAVPETTTSAMMSSFSPRRLSTVSFKSMSPMRQTSVSSSPTMSTRWKARS